MKSLRIGWNILAVAFFMLAFSSLAHAQATRTWVSGLGDDAQPCSRTAPCKTFAGAISKTAAGGEIDCLDPGGFGAVTITKAITLNGEATLCSVLVTGTNGIVVSAPAGTVVKLIHLKIFGGSQTPSTAGINGILFNSGQNLIVEDTKVYDFGTSCITVNGAGLQLTVNDSTMNNCNNGVIAENGAHATIRNSSATNNSVGVQAGPGGGIADVFDSNLSFNNTGASGNGAGSILNLGTDVITFNATLGVNSNGGAISTFGDNRFINNASDGLIPAGVGSQTIPKK